MNATECYDKMLVSIKQHGFIRVTNDTTSPAPPKTIEAQCGNTYVIDDYCNVVQSRSIDLTWSVANVLHFFTGSEEASMLPRYNEHAGRFLVDNIWPGAYGAIAMPQIRLCIRLLKECPWSRRAIVTMGTAFEQDINRPACWTSLHFLNGLHGLDLLVYQRSLSLGVMPYDCILLTNVLQYVAMATGLNAHALYWTVGSLHMDYEQKPVVLPRYKEYRIMLPYEWLKDPQACMQKLIAPTSDDQYTQWLKNKVRT